MLAANDNSAGRRRGTVGGDPLSPAWATKPTEPADLVDLVDADPAWIAHGEQECDRLETLLAPPLVASVERVGFTATPDLAASPTIDLQASVSDLSDPDPIAAVFADWYYAIPTWGQRPWRRVFVTVIRGRRRAYFHVVTPDSRRW